VSLAFDRASSAQDDNPAQYFEILPSDGTHSSQSGGLYSSFESKNGYIYEKTRTSDTSAYMLVYVRDADREQVLNEVLIEEIPQHLKVRFDEENKINQKLDED
jgi:hypothetical protein